MSDKESNDEIQVISERLQTATTIDSTCNNSQHQEKASRKGPPPEGKKPCPLTTGTSTASTTITSTILEDYVQVRSVPELNLPEKIVLVIDTVREQQCTPFKLGTGATFPPLYMIKRVVENFVGAKSTIQPGVHEYALMSLDSRGASWLCDYTSNVKSLVGHLEGVEDTPDEERGTCDLGRLFETIHGRIATPSTSQPLFVSRVILVYGRSNSIPKFHTGQKYLESLTKNPYFFLDVLFVHEPASEDNLCEAVYAEIAALDTTSYSYIFEVGRNAAKLHDNMAKLLAHPLQRPLQKDAFYTFASNAVAQEVHTNV
ncbi:BRISC and BRCA1-A complex member 1-like [Nylanderia fulva]|uniref:BRISC and BRCA1-A complex member 1-like n=1 Tax=Nylanderia fulva TaxID=613905 RepID=UPI0010FB5FD0|nr:BRISC and BRCA1-A complex member 1-like [Nylanderia fulva]XP_029167370.1 BRISC and BRCA1-A complex member 1-like [Nylanderia fulva]